MVAAGQDVDLVHALVLLLVRPGARGHLLHNVGPATRLRSGSVLQDLGAMLSKCKSRYRVIFYQIPLYPLALREISDQLSWDLVLFRGGPEEN